MPAPTSSLAFRVAVRLGVLFILAAVSAGLYLGERYLHDEIDLRRACDLLGVGDVEAAQQLLNRLSGAPGHGDHAHLGLRAAAALAQDASSHLGTSSKTSAHEAASSADPSVFPVAVWARRAFEDGHPEGALRLVDLAREVGQLPNVVVEAAALIELGRGAEAIQRWQSAPTIITARHGELAGRVGRYLATWDDHAAVFLYDREGRTIGHVTGEKELVLASGVRPEWIPRTVLDLARRAPGSGALRLSLDLELSRDAFESFGRWYRGSIVLLDPKTGEILAAVSDRRTFAESSGTPAFEQLREPASISKLITTTAYLRAGRDPDAALRRARCTGAGRYSGKLLYCPHVGGPLRGLDKAMAISCNTAFADLGVEIGRRRLLEELRLYGFTDAGTQGTARVAQPWGNDRQLADMSIGLEATDVTPLHAALIAATTVDGALPQPTLLLAEDGRLGYHPRPRPPAPPQQVLEATWLPTLHAAMRAVSERGTGRNMAPRSFPVAMKTGTASHPRYGFHTNYVGFGPLSWDPQIEPRIAFAVRVTHQPTSRKVRAASRWITARLLREIGKVASRRGWTSSAPTLPEMRLPRLAQRRIPKVTESVFATR